MSQDFIVKASEIIKANTAHGENGFGFCTISLIDEDGFPTATVATPAKSDGIKWMTFGAMLDGNKAKRVVKNNRASISFATMEYGINLVGEVEILTDKAIKDEMWYDGLSAHFETGKPCDHNYCVLKFTTKRYKLFLDFQEVEGTL
ncbi:MAG: pyridoxamine 5'-phosphate oxidase family protein [Defluviitaleaceae bacterium]|nr:pyridoxamine 5'-phosphate oxidase family protein [Defluviitaleaceae bacterium]